MEFCSLLLLLRTQVIDCHAVCAQGCWAAMHPRVLLIILVFIVGIMVLLFRSSVGAP
jgi:hypothetical protein